jgi:SAM-dependent methyltransferase
MEKQREPWRDGWRNRSDYAETFYKRALGELPEMECSKAAAELLKPHVRPGDKILDVGCGGGHYLRSFRRVIQIPFSYTGLDATPDFLAVGQKVWAGTNDVAFQPGDIYEMPFRDAEFDIVLCNDVLYHLPSIVRPVSELLRVARKFVQVRTLIGTRSFRIQEVYSSRFFPGAQDIDPSEEFADNGEPRSFAYLNIHSKDYFTSVIRRSCPGAGLEYIKDIFFDPKAIERSSTEWDNPNPTSILDGQQVIGYVIMPYHFVQIRKI